MMLAHCFKTKKQIKGKNQLMRASIVECGVCVWVGFDDENHGKQPVVYALEQNEIDPHNKHLSWYIAHFLVIIKPHNNTKR